MKKVFIVLGFIVFILLGFITYVFIGDPPLFVVQNDRRYAAEIKKIREDKSNWMRYTNNELGFSILYPLVDSEPRNAPGRLIIQTDGGPESISVSVLDDFEENRADLKKYAGTELIQLSEDTFNYYGEKPLSFSITGGRHIEWMYRDNIFPISTTQPHSKAAEEEKLLQLEILKTVEFFSPTTKK